MHVTAIIAAAGAGRRLGAAVPKQMLQIGGRTILERSVSAFASHPRINEVIVALPAELAAEPPAWLRQHHSIRVVEGGARRQDSVAAAFDKVATTSDIILVHDAARPFVSSELIGRCIDGAAAFGGAIAALPVSDTVKRVVNDGGAPLIDATLPRESIYLAQTPQGFRRDVLARRGRARAIGSRRDRRSGARRAGRARSAGCRGGAGQREDHHGGGSGRRSEAELVREASVRTCRDRL